VSILHTVPKCDLTAQAVQEHIRTLEDCTAVARLRRHAATRIALSTLPDEEKAAILLACLDRCPCLSQRPILSALAWVSHESVVSRLRKVVTIIDRWDRFAALKALAVQKDSSVLEHCRNDLNWGTSERITDAILILGILDTTEAKEVLEQLWNSSDLQSDHRLLVAIRLAECGNCGGERILEEALRSCKHESKYHSPEAERQRQIVSENMEISITAALAVLRNQSGLTNMKELLETAKPEKLNWMRRVFSRVLSISLLPVGDWRERALAWNDQELRNLAKH
jgi:hypothetical protein